MRKRHTTSIVPRSELTDMQPHQPGINDANKYSRIDLLMTHQWQRPLDIQQVQTDVLEEVSERRG